MRLPTSEHRRHNWRVHTLAPDFELCDVWEFPIRADARQGEDLALFWRRFVALQGRLTRRGIVGWLFGLRRVLGRVFGWDRVREPLPIPGTSETSVRERLPPDEASAVVEGSLQPLDGEGFQLVYQSEEESLHEISNGTVHALLHLGWVHSGGSYYTPQLAVYVRPRGQLGRLYLALIEPFRRWLVYPAMMRAMRTAWYGSP